MNTAMNPREALLELVEAVEARIGTMNYYFGPAARTDAESVRDFRRIQAAIAHSKVVLDGRPKRPKHVPRRAVFDPYGGRVYSRGVWSPLGSWSWQTRPWVRWWARAGYWEKCAAVAFALSTISWLGIVAELVFG